METHYDWKECPRIEDLTPNELPDPLRPWFRPVWNKYDPDDALGIEPEGASLYRSALSFQSPIAFGIVRADFYRLDLPDGTLYTFVVMETQHGELFVDDVIRWRREDAHL